MNQNNNIEYANLQDILEATPIAILIVDPQYCIKNVNREAGRFFGKDFSDIKGFRCGRMLNCINSFKDHRGCGYSENCSLCQFYTALKKCIQYGQSTEGEEMALQVSLSDGTVDLRWLRFSVNPVILGGIRQAVAAMVDITDNKRLEEDLINAKKAAESANIAKSRFLASMSHEIRTPMNPILNLTRLLLETELTSQQRDYAESVLAASENLLLLLNDILDLSKIEAGKLDLNFIDFNLNHILNSSISLISSKAREKGLYVKCDMEPDVWKYLNGDSHRLHQILLNLLINALKFTHEGGISINIALEDEDDEKILIRFAVSDTGIGIPEKQLGTLFKPFSQANSSITPKYGGTGLGLAISKEIVQRMGGQIGVKSTEGAGSTFWFTARFEKKEQVQKSAEILKGYTAEQKSDQKELPTHGNMTLPPMKILLVEDNLLNQKVALGILNSLGLCADVANNGKEAVEMVEKKDYDLVFMDIAMPEMDGVEATKRIRALDSKLPDIPIIAMTAHAMQGAREYFIEAGMNDYICKPINPDEFFAAICRHFKHRSGQTVEVECSDSDHIADFKPDSDMVFNRDNFLDRLGKNEEILKQLVAIIPDNMSDEIKELKRVLDSGNAEDIRLRGHTIKGMAANFSAERVSATAYQIELAGKAGDVDLAVSLVSRLEHEAAEVKSVLLEMFPEIFTSSV
ncbi:MAG: response regulator [Desulfamplus sp.]|nr:response regulator [Desulfamplus sp.]